MRNFKDIAGSDRSSCLIYKMVHIIVVVRYEIEKMKTMDHLLRLLSNLTHPPYQPLAYSSIPQSQ